MNAIHTPRPSGKTVTPHRVASRSSRRSPKQHQTIAWETAAKLSANVVLSVAAVSALAQLLPYQLSQHEKLQELKVEVQQTEARVNQLQASFNHQFDPQQARNIMQEQSQRVDPKQRQIVWRDVETEVEEPGR